MDFFLFKKLIGVFIMPLPIIILLMVACLYWIITDNRKKAILSLFLATVLIVAVSLPSLPNKLVHSLEHKYPQFDQANDIQAIVVLGCGHINDRTLPITSQLRPCSIIRATEAIRIWQQHPNARIYTSGNVGKEPFSNAYMTKQFLVNMGIPSPRITAIEQSQDTQEEAQNLASHLQGQRFALVSSATHLDRAMTLFTEQGLTPVAAPTEHLVRRSANPAMGYYFPSADNVKKMERWWYEIMGRTWVWLTHND